MPGPQLASPFLEGWVDFQGFPPHCPAVHAWDLAPWRPGPTACTLRPEVPDTGPGWADPVHCGFRIPLWGGVLITIVDTFFFLFLDNYGE